MIKACDNAVADNVVALKKKTIDWKGECFSDKVFIKSVVFYRFLSH